MFASTYTGRRVLVTGHTGFKGSWLCAWLEKLGADVCGYALDPISEPAHWNLLSTEVRSHISDIRDPEALAAVLAEHRPEIVFHLAAQPSVLVSYDDPVDTFTSNVVGTVNLLEAVRHTDFVEAVVVITTDKVYDNKEWLYGYRESDRLGGHDAYSASKACTEMVVDSYRRSFFRTQPEAAKIASARAGNVIGGGDWTADRLLPDAMVAASEGRPVQIRNPNSSRPWQHVLEPLSGYLRLGQALLTGQPECDVAWNFGPALDSNLTTSQVIDMACTHWPELNAEYAQRPGAPHEAGLLMLDSTQAARRLAWHPVWPIAPTLEKTVTWYRRFYVDGDVTTGQDIDAYMSDAQRAGLEWAT